MNKATNLVIFAAGVGVGAIAAIVLTKRKYELMVQEELDSIKKAFSVNKTEDEKISSEPEEDEALHTENEMKEKPSLIEYAKKISEEEKYINYSSMSEEKETETETTENVEEPSEDTNKPYVIEPDDFDTIDGYSTVSLTWYDGDNLLADDNDEVIVDVEDVIGFESLNHFGDYEDDCVFVRNDRLKIDYEVLLDNRNYRDVVPPHKWLGATEE